MRLRQPLPGPMRPRSDSGLPAPSLTQSLRGKPEVAYVPPCLSVRLHGPSFPVVPPRLLRPQRLRWSVRRLRYTSSCQHREPPNFDAPITTSASPPLRSSRKWTLLLYSFYVLFAEPLTPPGNQGRKTVEEKASPNEYSLGLLDLHSFDTELLFTVRKRPLNKKELAKNEEDVIETYSNSLVVHETKLKTKCSILNASDQLSAAEVYKLHFCLELASPSLIQPWRLRPQNM